jgi:hypothetical protein
VEWKKITGLIVISYGRAVAALHLPAERGWFVSHLAESTAELEFKSWDEIRAV